MLKFYVRHGMVIDKVHEIISLKQSMLLEKNISFITQNGIGLETNLKKILN